MDKCKYCNIDFINLNRSEKANHSRWCKLNPNREKYLKKLNENRKSIKSKGHNQYTKAKKECRLLKMSNETKEKIKISSKGKHHSEITKQKLSELGLSNPYRRKCKSIIYYNGFRFDSTWEVEVAKILDKNSIKWIQPKPLKWVDDEGKKHNYFSDFYLPDYDLYLDPKNDYCIKVQKEKLKYIEKHYSNVHILSSRMINEDYILGILAL